MFSIGIVNTCRQGTITERRDNSNGVANNFDKNSYVFDQLNTDHETVIISGHILQKSWNKYIKTNKSSDSITLKIPKEKKIQDSWRPYALILINIHDNPLSLPTRR